MSGESTFESVIESIAQNYFDKVEGKNIQDLGGTEAVVSMLMDEFIIVYQLMISMASSIDNLFSIADSFDISLQSFNDRFSRFDDKLIQMRENLTKQNAALAESLNKSLQSFNKQMTNQNKVLDKQVITLSKSVSKITGGNS